MDKPISWDQYFMGVALLSAMRSKDPNTKVGTCIVSSNKRYVNDRISLLEKKYGIELHRYEYGKGLPIGYRNYNIMQTVIMKLCFLFYN